MAVRSISEAERVRYLLGRSSPAERERIESEYFADDDAFQEMLAAEDDLLDGYARGELVREERARFAESFLNSLHGDRIKFARALAGAVSPARSVETQLRGTRFNAFKILQSPALLRTATIAAMIVFVALCAWLIRDRRRMANELRELRAESAELRKQTQALQRTKDNKQTPTAEITVHLSDRPRPNTSRHGEKDRDEVANGKSQQAQNVNTGDTTLGNSFMIKQITELPLDPTNIMGLLSLEAGLPRSRYVTGERTDQSKITLNGLDVSLNTYSLPPANMSSGETIIFIKNSLTWIRLQLTLETAAIHEDCRIIIKTANGRALTAVDWTEPLTANQTIIDTPVISTNDLPAGDYVLVLLGKEPDGPFVQVAEYAFRVIRYE